MKQVAASKFLSQTDVAIAAYNKLAEPAVAAPKAVAPAKKVRVRRFIHSQDRTLYDTIQKTNKAHCTNFYVYSCCCFGSFVKIPEGRGAAS